ncbi:MAG: putative Zn-binding protein involved in type VI secretion [Phenylobacterium sp.]|jgi:uncharacterized Zn-binding protein involved in type VI secretion
MPGVCLNAYITNVHSLYLPGVAVATAANFMVGGIPILRKGDPVMIHVHPDPKKPPHVGVTVSAGASNFLVGGQPVARQNDAVSCGGKMMMGFPKFIIG